MKNKINQILDEGNHKESKKSKQSAISLDGLQILEREHPVGSEDSPLMKYSSVLYSLEMPTNYEKKLKIS